MQLVAMDASGYNGWDTRSLANHVRITILGRLRAEMRPKCPVCGGPPNRMWFSHLDTRKDRHVAVFVVECWTGALQKVSKHHYFQANIKLLSEVEVDQIQKLEHEIDMLKEREAEG